MRKWMVGVLLGGLVALFAASAQAADNEELAKKIADLEKRVAQLEGKSETSLSAYWKNGLYFENSIIKARIGGRLQVDWAMYVADSQLEGAKTAAGYNFADGAEFRRAYVELDGTLYTNVIYKAQFDFADAAKGGSAPDGVDEDDTKIVDLYAGVTGIPVLGTVRVGHIKEPFSLDASMSNNNIMFMERALPVLAFAPGRHLGIMANNNIDERVTWAVGAFRSREGQGGQWAVTGRVTALPMAMDQTHLLHVGAAGSYRHYSAAYTAAPESNLIGSGLIGTAANFPPSATDNAKLLGAEMALILGPFTAQAEYMVANVEASNSDDPNFDGWYAQAGYFLTGESRTYDAKNGVLGRVTPFKNFSLKQGGTGAVELAARYSRLSLKGEGFRGAKADDITAGLNWYLNPNTRVMLNYVHASITNGFVRNADLEAYQLRFQVDF